MYLWWSSCTFSMPGESCCGQLRSLLLCLCDVCRALIKSLMCRFCTSALALVQFQTVVKNIKHVSAFLMESSIAVCILSLLCICPDILKAYWLTGRKTPNYTCMHKSVSLWLHWVVSSVSLEFVKNVSKLYRTTQNQNECKMNKVTKGILLLTSSFSLGLGYITK